jgi:serine protease Do
VGFDELDLAHARRLGLPDDHGAYVAGVAQGSPAESTGIEKGDVILEWNGRAVVDPTDLAIAVAGTQIGSMAKIVIWRDEARQTLDVKVGQRPGRVRISR